MIDYPRIYYFSNFDSCTHLLISWQAKSELLQSSAADISILVYDTTVGGVPLSKSVFSYCDSLFRVIY